jgi:hypothetical protein
VIATIRSSIRSFRHQHQNLHKLTYLYLSKDRDPTSHHLVVLCTAETEAILPYLMGVPQDSAWVTLGCPLRYRMEDMH